MDMLYLQMTVQEQNNYIIMMKQQHVMTITGYYRGTVYGLLALVLLPLVLLTAGLLLTHLNGAARYASPLYYCVPVVLGLDGGAS